jgi:N-acetylmuramoyl-L-alanine amidase
MPAVRSPAIILLLLLAGCTTPGLPLRTALPVFQTPSPSFDARRPSFVILHHTGSGYAERALRTLTAPRSEVSAHYLVARDGSIHYLVDEMNRAWHAGDSSWGGARDMNSGSIGVEVDNDGEEPYAEAQIATLLALLADLKQRWKIPAANFLGHGDVAPGRKTDPGIAFPWRRLADSGFGLWCEPPYPPAPVGVDNMTLLSAFGYEVWNPPAAVAAFKRHFVPEGNEREMTQEDRARLYCLVQRKSSRD